MIARIRLTHRLAIASLASLLLCGLATRATFAAQAATARDSGDPIRLMYIEGDVAGLTSIQSPDGASVIGYVQYRQHRRGDVLEAVRIARFKDGTSDEDHVRARVGKELRTIGGRSIIRNSKGVPTVDLTIDVAGGRITGFSGLGSERQTYDEHVDLPPGTYWGPLISIALKNFDQNADADHLVFRTVVATPKPRVLDMEVVRKQPTKVHRRGGTVDAVHFQLYPSVNKLIDPIVRAMAPETDFFIEPGTPPAIARFEGPRNYAGQKIRIE